MSTGNFKIKFSPPTQNLTLKNTTVVQNRLDRMLDVSEPDGGKVTGALLVYDAPSDNYILRDVLTYDEESDAFKLNGGEF